MTTPSGQISLGNVRDEFGASGSNGSVSLGNYRVNQSIAGRNWPLDYQVPSSGSIGLGQLKGKTLNVVVDYSGGLSYGVSGISRYDSSGIVVGGFKSRPASNSGQTKKVFHMIRQYIGGSKTITSYTPTSPTSPPSFFFGSPSPSNNTLGYFYIEYNTNIGPAKRICTGTGANLRCTWVAPDTSGTSSIDSPVLSLSGSGTGGTMTLRKVTTKTVTSRNGTYYRTTYVMYYIIGFTSGQGYSKATQFNVYWDSRTFTFTILATTPSGPALTTGSGWGGIVVLNFTITSGAIVSGIGGDGGDGSGNNTNSSVGTPGGNAFGANYPAYVVVEPNGILQAGSGGGGGGGSGYSDPDDNPQDPVDGGGGGGGGAGIPAGSGGYGGPGGGAGQSGSGGYGGSYLSGGRGGNGGYQGGRNTSYGGGGGGGGFDGAGGSGSGGSVISARSGSPGTLNGGGAGGRGGYSGRSGSVTNGSGGGATGLAIVYTSGVSVYSYYYAGGTIRGGSGQSSF